MTLEQATTELTGIQDTTIAETGNAKQPPVGDTTTSLAGISCRKRGKMLDGISPDVIQPNRLRSC